MIYRNPNEVDGGEIRFGGINPLRFKGDITWASVTDQSHWQFNLGVVQMLENQFCVNGCTAFIGIKQVLCNILDLIIVQFADES